MFVKLLFDIMLVIWCSLFICGQLVMFLSHVVKKKWLKVSFILVSSFFFILIPISVMLACLDDTSKCTDT